MGEMKDPSHDLPRVLRNAMIVVVSLSILANIAFYSNLSIEVMQDTNAIALVSQNLSCRSQANRLGGVSNISRLLVKLLLDEQARISMPVLSAYHVLEPCMQPYFLLDG